jgi:hypothetical protein
LDWSGGFRLCDGEVTKSDTEGAASIGDCHAIPTKTNESSDAGDKDRGPKPLRAKRQICTELDYRNRLRLLSQKIQELAGRPRLSDKVDDEIFDRSQIA